MNVPSFIRDICVQVTGGAEYEAHVNDREWERGVVRRRSTSVRRVVYSKCQEFMQNDSG